MARSAGTTAAGNALVLGGSSDAQTQGFWSEQMAQAIGGVFIRSGHPGHTAVFNGQSECVDQLVSDFLLDALVPAATECR